MSSETNVSLWVKAEPFSYGAFHIAPHPRLNFNVSYIGHEKCGAYRKTCVKLPLKNEQNKDLNDKMVD